MGDAKRRGRLLVPRAPQGARLPAGFAPAGHSLPGSSCAPSEPPPRRRSNPALGVMVANGAIINGVELAYNRIATPDGNVSVIGFQPSATLPTPCAMQAPCLAWDLTPSSAVMRRARESFLVRELSTPRSFSRGGGALRRQLRRLQRERQGLSNAANGSNGTAGVAEADVVSPAPSVPSPPPRGPSRPRSTPSS